MAKKLIATKNIQVDVGSSHVELTAGHEVDPQSLPAGAVESMCRLGELVDPADFPAEKDASPPAPSAAQLATPVADIGLEKHAVDALTAADLATVGDVLKYGYENNGLQKLDGIGEATEKQIRAAIEKLLA